MVLALSVIALHTGFPDGMPDLVKQAFVNGLYRIAVPVFAVISGYFFLAAVQAGRPIQTIQRILLLYVTWMLIYLPIYGPELTSIGHAVRLWFFGYFHLWFLPGLAISAALVAALWWLRLSAAVIAGLAGICAAIGLALQFMVMTDRASISLDLYRNGLFVIFPYFATGFLLARQGATRLPDGWGWQLVLLAMLAVIVESLIWYRIADGGFGVDNMASLLVAAPVLFLAARGTQGLWDGKRIASMSAFVYFFHILMMITASRFGLDGNAKALFVMAASVGTAWVLSRGPRRAVLDAVT